MKPTEKRGRGGKRSLARDIISVILIVVPFLGAAILNVLTKPASDGIDVTGAQVYFTVKADTGSVYHRGSGYLILRHVGASRAVSVPDKRAFNHRNVEKAACGGADRHKGSVVRKRQHGRAVCRICTLCRRQSMGLSAFSSLSSLLGLYPATSDLNIVAGWAILVFILITHYKLKGGIGPYLKGFVEPIPIFAPFNVIGEIATPVSMAFRHYGNVLSGVVISTLVAAGLSGLSSLLLGWLPGALGRFPLLRIGLPAILSLYFDLFSGCLQAFIFAMLTMLYISNGFPEEDYEKRRKKKAEKALRASRQH